MLKKKAAKKETLIYVPSREELVSVIKILEKNAGNEVEALVEYTTSRVNKDTHKLTLKQKREKLLEDVTIYECALQVYRSAKLVGIERNKK